MHLTDTARAENNILKNIGHELKSHAPFTIFGALTGIGIMALMVHTHVPKDVSRTLFAVFHPSHVLLSALVTTAMYKLHGKGSLGATIVIGYIGSVGIATVSDSLIPYLGECLLELPNRHVHLGFIEEWWLVNPLAFLGIAIAWFWPRTKVPHAGHVLLSTWASLFHITMAVGEQLSPLTMLLAAVFLFLAVWVPCCTSDIVFPLLFARQQTRSAPHEHNHI